ncbi:hypothetical protein MVEN_00057200 [Mycena venus]|uniref:Uncharacterized protein n=1 Tax=Mycena venus TaxID=2733690 RepID=A0A8H6Z913_9AGAR|nr:hypothetical protein MVEN_00057200 [Mycena venus]
MENFVNADCSHQYLRTYFQPATGLTTYNSLDPSDEPVEVGWRSKASQRELSWTVLNLNRSPPSGRCCSRCTPDVLSRYPASNRHDARLKAFASDFLFPIPAFSRRRRMDSVSSTDSRSAAGNHSPTRPTFIPFTHKVQLPKEQRDDLVVALDKWRIEKQARRAGGQSLFSKQVFLSDARLKKIADHGGDFLRAAMDTPDLIGKFAQLDLASNEDLKDMASVIMVRRPDAQLAIDLTPRGGHRQKQQNTAVTPSRSTDETPRRPMQPIAQPSFSLARLARGRSRGRGRGRGAGAAGRQLQTTTVNAGDIFAPTMPPFTVAPNPPPIHPSPHTSSTSQQQLRGVLSTPHMPYYSPAYLPYTPNEPYYHQMYPMYALPPRYYPSPPNDENRNVENTIENTISNNVYR